LRACMNELPLTDPRVDVTTIRANKERRLPGTCEWILNRPEYKSWSDGKGAQDLLLIGGPGIGKTMLSMFLVDTLKEKIQQSKQMLVYFFCDDKDARRRSDTAILRGLLYQLLDGELCKHMLAPYRRLGKSLFTQFDELAQIFSSVLESIPNGPVHILIDAMDECGATSLGRVMKLLGDLMTRKAKMKLLVTSRPHRTVEDCFKKCVQVDSERVKEDVDRYIKSKVKDLAKNERYSDDLKESVLSALQERSDGTFLWTSLILEHISDAASDEKAVLKTLQVLPRNLNGVYRRILSEIERKYSKEARFVFRLLVAARRPLTVDEVDVAYHLWTNKEAAYLSDHQIRKDIYKCCGSLVYLDREHRTVNFSHQSAKDYLMNADHQYRVLLDESNLQLFKICWQYLVLVLPSEKKSQPSDRADARKALDKNKQFQYAKEEWIEHALASSPASISQVFWASDDLERFPTLREEWLLASARQGHLRVLNLLLEKGANGRAESEDGCTPMILAAWEGHHLIVGLLLNCEGFDVNRVDIDGDCALNSAAFKGRDKVVKILLNSGRADVNIRNKRAFTPLLSALDSAHESTTKILLGADNVDLSCRTDENRTMLSYAAANGYEDVVKILLQHSELDLNVRCRNAMFYAAMSGHESVVKFLIDNTNVEVDRNKHFGKTPLASAANGGHAGVVKLLMETGKVDVNNRDRWDCTPFLRAAKGGHEEVVKLLMKVENLDLDPRTEVHRTPLSYAAEKGHESIVTLL
ncbi:ankyrin repeat-containing domain protein, partial [Mariannaea sp. PMI_226]